MAATYLLLGEPEWPQMLFYLVVLFLSVGGFVLTVFVIRKKVFGGRGGARLLTINPDAAEGRTNERR